MKRLGYGAALILAIAAALGWLPRPVFYAGLAMGLLSSLGFLRSLAFIIILALRGWHIIILAPLAAIIAASFSGLNVLDTLTGPYMTGFTNYARKFYLIFLMGTLFGRFMEDSGAARSIAHAILKLIGGGADKPLRVMVAFSLVPMALTYGGVSLFARHLHGPPHRPASLAGSGHPLAPFHALLCLRRGIVDYDHDSWHAADSEHHAHKVHGLHARVRPVAAHALQ